MALVKFLSSRTKPELNKMLEDLNLTPNEEEIYCLNCFECEFKQGEMEEPSGYQEKPENCLNWLK